MPKTECGQVESRRAALLSIITTEAALGVYGAVDCGLFDGSFLLAAESAGVGPYRGPGYLRPLHP
jgi:hypothetical protein